MKLAVVRKKLQKVDRAIEKAIARGELPGCVVLARMGEELSYEGVFGAACLSPDHYEARRETVYDLASLTKVIGTTSVIVTLVRDDQLCLDDPITEER